MSTRIVVLLSVLLWIGVKLAAAESVTKPLDPRRIDLFTDGSLPFTHLEPIASRLELQVFDLDAPARLQAELSEGLPRDPAAAERLARERLDTLGRQRLATRFADAYAGLLKALEVGIDRYPAVVFDDGESVVYGVTDLEQALAHYRRWRRQSAQGVEGDSE